MAAQSKHPYSTSDVTRSARLPAVLLCALTPRNHERLLITIALCLTAATFASAVTFPFIHDDFLQIVDNAYLRSWKLVPLYFHPGLWATGWTKGGEGRAAVFYRPFFFIWLLLNYLVFGAHPAGWHVTTILVHLLVTFLVFRLALALGLDAWTAFIATAIFGLHPAHIEVVAWIGGVTESLAAAFFLLALLAYLRARGKATWIVAACALLAAGILCKESAATLPLIIFGYELTSQWTTGVASALQRAARASAPFFAVVFAYVAIRLYLFGGPPQALSEVPLTTMVFTWPSVLWFYVRHLFAPLGLSLFYDTYYVTSASLTGFWLPLFFVIATATALCWLASKKTGTPPRLALFATLWIFLLLLPVLNFRVFNWREIAHDRYLYLPSVGFAILLALILARLRLGSLTIYARPAAQVLVVLLLCAALAASTAEQTLRWSGPLDLYLHAVQVAPNNVGAVAMLALEMMARGRTTEAADLYERATRLAPNWWEAHAMAGRLAFGLERYPDAARHFRRAIELKAASDSSFYLLLGLAEVRSGNPAAAEAPIRHAIIQSPNAIGYHHALAESLAAQNRAADAIAELEAEIAQHPDNQQARTMLEELRRKSRSR